MDEPVRSLFEQVPDAQIVAAFDDAPIAMALAVVADDGDRVIRSANRALAELLGRSREDLVGSGFRELTHPDDQGPSERAAAEVLAGLRTEFEGRKRYVDVDGHAIWVEVFARRIASPNPDRLSLVHVLDVRDRVELESRQAGAAQKLEAEVSERTQAHADAERRLRLSLGAERDLLEESQDQQQQLNVSLRAAGLGTCEIDLMNDRISYDERARSILGIGEDPISNDAFLELVHDDDRDGLLDTIRTAVADHTAYEVVFRIDARAAGGMRWIQGWGQPVEDELGTVRKILGVMRDVTVEREERRLVEEREQRLQLVLDVTVTGVFEWDLERRTIVFNDDWFESLGYARRELSTDRWDWRRVVHPDDWPEMERLVNAHLVGTMLTFGHELRLRRKDGTWRWSRISARVLERDADGRALRVIGADTDISSQRTLEQQLAHSAKMQSLGEFAGGIAHDFNNVMAIVRGHTEALLRLELGVADVDRRLGSIDRAVERAARLVRDLMLLARPGTDNPVVIDLAAHLPVSAASWPAFLGADIELQLDIPPGTFPVRIDTSRLDAVLLNVASNARDAMPDGGLLRVELVTATDLSGSAVVELALTDDGIGMGESTLTPLFEPFFTTKPPGVGTGLGLATSFTTITQAGGEISAESELGVGTTIRIALPLLQVGELDVEAVPEVAGDIPTSARSAAILVVEDEAEILQLNADVLRLAGHRVYEALDGAEALELLHGGASIDLLLTDAIMPGVSGPELAATVHEFWPDVRVLYLSGYAASTQATDRIDPNDLLLKPVTAAALVQAVAAALDRPR